jgi:tetratricopeptide (TPR) repeat protein
MKVKIPLLAALLLAVALPLRAEPKLDPKRIINESNSFLKEREPEMTEEEYALYEKVVTMLATNPEFAVKLLEAMQSDKEAPSPAFQFILGNAYYAAGEIDKAESNYKASLNRFPTFLRAWVNLGILYYAGQRYPEAAPCFSKAVSLGDRDASTFGLLGYSLQQTGDLVSAEMAYMQALSSDPSNSDWKEGLLGICIDGKQYARAESLVKNLIRERPSEGRYWLAYANILIAEGKKVEATVVLETCVGSGVAGTTEEALLGDLYAEQGLAREAAGTYAKILPASTELGQKKLLSYARVLIAGGKLDEAKATLASLSPRDDEPAYVELHQEQADLLAGEKDWSGARRELDLVLKKEPLNGRALVSQGRAYAGEDDIPRATLSFETAYTVAASTYVASLELANIELRNKHYAKTIEYLQKALSLERSDAIQDFLARVRTLVSKED